MIPIRAVFLLPCDFVIAVVELSVTERSFSNFAEGFNVRFRCWRKGIRVVPARFRQQKVTSLMISN